MVTLRLGGGDGAELYLRRWARSRAARSWRLSLWEGCYGLEASAKSVAAVVIAGLAVALVAFMPTQWEDRMQTIDPAASTARRSGASTLGRWPGTSPRTVLSVEASTSSRRSSLRGTLRIRWTSMRPTASISRCWGAWILGAVPLPASLVAGMAMGGANATGCACPGNQDGWSNHLASMIQVSLIGYLVGGAFLSLAYFDLPYNLLILVVVAGKALASEKAAATRLAADPFVAAPQESKQGYA